MLQFHVREVLFDFKTKSEMISVRTRTWVLCKSSVIALLNHHPLFLHHLLCFSLLSCTQDHTRTVPIPRSSILKPLGFPIILFLNHTLEGKNIKKKKFFSLKKKRCRVSLAQSVSCCKFIVFLTVLRGHRSPSSTLTRSTSMDSLPCSKRRILNK